MVGFQPAETVSQAQRQYIDLHDQLSSNICLALQPQGSAIFGRDSIPVAWLVQLNRARASARILRISTLSRLAYLILAAWSSFARIDWVSELGLDKSWSLSKYCITTTEIRTSTVRSAESTPE